MTVTIAQALENHFNKTAFTENGAISNKSTNSRVLDLFSQAGALRTGRGAENAHDLFLDAYNEDPLLTVKTLFYFRDVRGGQGERETFRVFLRDLANIAPHTVRRNLHLIPEYGRWDDLYALVGTSVESDALKLMREQFIKDLESDKPSILAKWLKSENTSSPKSRELARKTREAFGISPKTYRRGLSLLRKKIDVLERTLSSNQWDKVVYEHVPSQANLKYRKAFIRHDNVRYIEYLNKVNNGETKINASTQFPYEIVRNCSNIMITESERKTLDTMWNNQPDYIAKGENSICVCDVSGSMSGLPLHVSISLGIYTAERNTGPFHNKFLTFSLNPQLQEVKGRDIYEKYQNLSRAKWDMNTDIKKVFDTILNVAIKNNIKSEDMIKKIYVISDMEFDACAYNNSDTLFNVIKKEWDEKGYEMPLLVFWNVASRNKQFPMCMDDRGFLNVSGCSPSIFKNLMSGKILDAYEMMLEVLNSDRYKAITV